MRARCADCGKVWDEEALAEIKHLLQRVAPGEEMPAGECAECGALAYISTDQPFIWLQENEPEGTAECGCRLQACLEEGGSAFYQCPLHENAAELLEAAQGFMDDFREYLNSEEECDMPNPSALLTAIGKACPKKGGCQRG